MKRLLLMALAGLGLSTALPAQGSSPTLSSKAAEAQAGMRSGPIWRPSCCKSSEFPEINFDPFLTSLHLGLRFGSDFGSHGY